MQMIFKTSLVIRVFDYITMKPMAQVNFDLPFGYKVVPKGDGYFVVLGNNTPDFVTISNPAYSKIALSHEQLTYEMTIWLKPNINSYSNLIQCDNLENLAYKNDDLRLIQNKELEDEEIVIFYEYPIVLIGRKILLSDGEKSDVVTVLSQDNNKLKITQCKNTYLKIRTQVYILFQSQLDNLEQCVIQVPKGFDYIVI